MRHAHDCRQSIHLERIILVEIRDFENAKAILQLETAESARKRGFWTEERLDEVNIGSTEYRIDRE